MLSNKQELDHEELDLIAKGMNGEDGTKPILTMDGTLVGWINEEKGVIYGDGEQDNQG